jgi:hypothetical protein
MSLVKPVKRAERSGTTSQYAVSPLYTLLHPLTPLSSDSSLLFAVLFLNLKRGELSSTASQRGRDVHLPGFMHRATHKCTGRLSVDVTCACPEFMLRASQRSRR